MPIRFSVCRPSRHYSQENISVPADQRYGSNGTCGDVIDLPEVSISNGSNGTATLDRTDGLPDPIDYSWIDVAFIVFSICSFFFDVITDILVARFYWLNDDMWYFTMTIIFITIPTFVVTIISLRWYIVDSREEGAPKVSLLTWFIRSIFLILQLGPVIRYIESLIYGLKFKLTNSKNKNERRKWFRHMIYEDTDASMLRLFECFMESAPQLVLQLYIVTHKIPQVTGQSNNTSYWAGTIFEGQSFFSTPFIQAMSIIASLISLSGSLVSYHQVLRMSIAEKKNMSWKGMTVQFFWRFFMIGSRVLALALFSSRYRWLIGIFCLLHWLMAFGWILSMKTCFCQNRCEEIGYNALLAVMFIFCYFNPVDSPTRWRYITYYVTVFLENTILLVLFYIHPDTSKLWFRVPAIVGHYSAFFLGLTFMILYYSLFHPSLSFKKKQTSNVAPRT